MVFEVHFLIYERHRIQFPIVSKHCTSIWCYYFSTTDDNYVFIHHVFLDDPFSIRLLQDCSRCATLCKHHALNLDPVFN